MVAETSLQAPRVDANALARMSMAALDELFTELEPAALTQLQGHTRGRVLAVSGLDWLPAAARAAVFGAINELPIWRGEVVEGEFGANTWLLPGAQLEFARHLVRAAPALDGSGEVLRLDYDVAANPKPLRALVTELRALDGGGFLGRLQLVVRGRALMISYIALE